MNNQRAYQQCNIKFSVVMRAWKFFLVLEFLAALQTGELIAQEVISNPVSRFPNGIGTVNSGVPTSVMMPKEGWGSAVLDFRVGLVSDKKTYLLGEPVYVTICVSNVSSKAIRFVFSSGWPYDYDYIVRRNHSESIGRSAQATKDIQDELGRRAASYGGIDIRPAEGFLTSNCISKLYDLSEPGEYEIIAVYNLANIKKREMVPVQSGPIRIQISTQEKPTP